MEPEGVGTERGRRACPSVVRRRLGVACVVGAIVLLTSRRARAQDAGVVPATTDLPPIGVTTAAPQLQPVAPRVVDPSAAYTPMAPRMYAPMAPRLYAPMTRVIRPYEGGPVPPGWRVEQRRANWLLWVSGSVFGVFYLFSATAPLAGVRCSGGASMTWSCRPFLPWWGLIPVIGPWLDLADASVYPLYGGWDVGLVVAGVSQAVGLGVFIATMALPWRVLTPSGPEAWMHAGLRAWPCGVGACGVW